MLVPMQGHHAYFFVGDTEEGIKAALAYGEDVLGLSGGDNPDLLVLQYTLFSVDDARYVRDVAQRTSMGGAKLIVIAAPRMYHEAQNALLKVCEEPPPHTYLVLVVPTEGNMIETLRSRLLPLPGQFHENKKKHVSTGELFLTGTEKEREKIVEDILKRAKSDKAEEKQAARIEALRLGEELTFAAYVKYQKTSDPTLRALLSDLERLVPILHERSAPLKPILEHLVIQSKT